jgi:hypothetical protein
MDDSLFLPPRLAALLEDLPLDELAFDPVPVKARRDGWTAERQRGFILRLALIGGVAAAARSVGMSRESAYRLREHPGAAAFASAWDKAQGWGRSGATDLGIERALIGETRTVYYRGRKVGEQVRFDNRLLIAAMKRQAEPDPRSYRELADELDGLIAQLGCEPAGGASEDFFGETA